MLTLVFDDALSEDRFREFQVRYPKPRYKINYGCAERGGFDKRVLLIDFDNGEKFWGVTKDLEAFLIELGFRRFLWERLLPGRTSRANDLANFAPLNPSNP